MSAARVRAKAVRANRIRARRGTPRRACGEARPPIRTIRIVVRWKAMPPPFRALPAVRRLAPAGEALRLTGVSRAFVLLSGSVSPARAIQLSFEVSR